MYDELTLRNPESHATNHSNPSTGITKEQFGRMEVMLISYVWSRAPFHRVCDWFVNPSCAVLGDRVQSWILSVGGTQDKRYYCCYIHDLECC